MTLAVPWSGRSQVTSGTTAAEMWNVRSGSCTREMVKLVRECDGAALEFCTPLIVIWVLDLGKSRVFIALVKSRVKIAPESNRALTTRVFPVGPRIMT